MTMITPSYLGETIEYSSLHACRSTLEDPTRKQPRNTIVHGLTEMLDASKERYGLRFDLSTAWHRCDVVRIIPALCAC